MDAVAAFIFCLSLAFISTQHSSGVCSSSCPLSLVVSSVSTKQVGPSLHRVFSDSSSGLIPLDGMSAGFMPPGQCFQALIGTISLISSTRFWTNGFHSLLCPRIQNSATSESDQQVILLIFTSASKAFATFVTNLDKMSADRSSSLGMVCCATGATLVLEARNLM